MKRIKIDRSKCVGCLTCTTACIVSHSSEDTRSRITIDSNKKYAPIFCRHCDKPECVFTCMSGAMSKDKETGEVTYDKKFKYKTLKLGVRTSLSQKTGRQSLKR